MKNHFHQNTGLIFQYGKGKEVTGGIWQIYLAGLFDLKLVEIDAEVF